MGTTSPFSPSIRAGGFLELAELIDLHLALGEHGFNLQLASHGSNHGLQRADVHIGAALHLGDRGLVDAEQVVAERENVGVRVGGARRRVPRLRSG